MRLAPSRRDVLAGAAGLAGSALLPRPGRTQDVPRQGGRLVAAADSEPRNLNPAMIASNGVFYVASKVIEPLAEMGYQGLVPKLATSWSSSPDGLAHSFRLREGVSWHDGRAFTSADVAFSALEVWKPLQNLGQVVFKNLAGVDTPDATTAVLRFSAPTPGQLLANALPALTAVLPKHLYAGTDIAANPHNADLVGTGPFRYAEHKPGELYRVTRNDAYWGAGEPHLDEILWRVLPDRGAITAALEAREIDLACFSAVPLAELDRIGAIEGLSVITKGYEGITYQLTLEINHRRKELADVRVRRALAHAIDAIRIVDVVFLGYARAATGPVPATAGEIYAPDVPRYDYDPKKAEALLDEAGYPRGPDGVRFRLRLLPAPWFAETRATGDLVRQALKAVGIEAEVVASDTAAHTKAVYTDHAFDLAIGSPVYRNDPAISTTILFRGGLPAGVPFSNQYGYDDAAMNALIDTAATTVESASRTALYKDFQRKAAEELPLIFLVDFTFTTVASDRLHGVATNPRWATSSWADAWLAG